MPNELTLRSPLFAIEEELLTWADTLEIAETDEQRAEIQARVSEYLQLAVAKRDRFAEFLRHLEASEFAAKCEEDRLAKRRRQLAKMREHLEQYAVNTMETLGVRRLEGETHDLRLAKNPDRVEAPAVTALPFEFRLVTVKMSGAVWCKLCEMTKDAENVALFRELTNVANVSWEASKVAIKLAIKAGQQVPGADLVFGANRLEIK
jgi:hypothetical protein